MSTTIEPPPSITIPAPEPGRLSRWGTLAARRRRLVLGLALLFAVLAGAWGAGALGGMTGGAGFDDPGSESAQADRLLAGPLGRDAPDVTVLYSSPSLTVADPAFGYAVRAASARVPRDGVAALDTYWSTGDAAYVSRDRHATYATVRFTTDDDQAKVDAFARIEDSLRAGGMTTQFGGVTAMTQQVNEHVGKDIGRAELLSIPLLLVLLLFVFRGVIAMLLPLAVGGGVALGSFAVLRVVELFTDVSTFAINVVTILGLGLAIDYTLLMVSRFRRELRDNADVDAAVGATVGSAGRTVLFSALAVAVSFAGLAFFPSRFLSSLGYAAAAVTVFAAAGALIVLPALLRWCGSRVNKWRVPSPRRLDAHPDETRRRWYRFARVVLRRPLVATVLAVAVLAVLALPFFSANWARPAEWVLPSDGDARTVTQQLDSRFAADPNHRLTDVIVFPRDVDESTARAAATSYATRATAVTGVTSAAVTAVTRADGVQVRVSIGYRPDPMSREATTLVHDLRALPVPDGAAAHLTGMPASRADIVAMIGRNAPRMLAFVAVTTFVVLALAFGSVLLPLVALALNALCLLATLGVMTWVFQDGHLASLFGVDPIGALDVNFPVLVVAIAFGLATDYEAFLLARIREARRSGATGDHAIALGVQRSAGIVTSAALLLCVVVAGFLTASVSFMAMIGVGIVLAVLLDATLVRSILVPATTALLGERAWWRPRPIGSRR